MKSQPWLSSILVRLTSFALGYLKVDHPSMIWKRKGQFLILLQTVLMITSWSNFLTNLLGDYNNFLPSLQVNMVYSMVTLTQLGLIIVPILLAQRGKVRAAAHLMLLTSMVGLIKYAIARDFHQYNVLMMASMFVLIPMAGALLRPRASLIMAFIICGVEWGLTRLLDPNINPVVLPSIIWMNVNFGVVMTVILAIYELSLNDAGLGERARVQAAFDARHEDQEWMGWTVAYRVYDRLREPLKTLRGRLVVLEHNEHARMSPEARTEVNDMQASIQRLLKDLESVLEVYPSGIMAIELQRYDLSASWVLDRMGNEDATANGTRVIVHHEPTSPDRVHIAPVALRRAIEEIIQVMIAATGTQEVTIIDGVTDNYWLIRILSTAILPHPAAPLHPTDPVLRHAAARIHAMPGTLSIEATPGAPLVMTLRIPLEARG